MRPLSSSARVAPVRLGLQERGHDLGRHPGPQRDLHGTGLEIGIFVEVVCRGAVQRRGQRRDGVDALGHAADEERRELRRIRRRTLRLIAVGEKLREEPRRRAAEGVADQHKARPVVPRGDQRVVREVAAEALVPVLRGVRRTVVDALPGDLGIELAGTVPRASHRGDGRGVACVALLAEMGHEVATAHPPVRPARVLLVVAPPTGEAVDEDIGQVAHGAAPPLIDPTTHSSIREKHRHGKGGPVRSLPSLLSSCFGGRCVSLPAG